MSRWDDPYWDFGDPPEEEDDLEDPRLPEDWWDYYDGWAEEWVSLDRLWLFFADNDKEEPIYG